MNKLWAAVLTGLLCCGAVSRAADPVPLPVVTTPTAGTRPLDLKVPGSVRPVYTKSYDVAAPIQGAPAPLPKDTRIADPTPVAGGGCGAVPCGQPCETCTPCAGCNSCCASCGGLGLGNGKLRDWLSYRPCRTPLSECGAAPRIQHLYVFFLDVPCHACWQPSMCCENRCGTGGGVATGPNGAPTSGALAPAPAVAPMVPPAGAAPTEPQPVMPKNPPGH
jgi:hypothetical protein